MRFQVLTTANADDELAALWVNALPGLRDKITEACAFFDNHLRRDAELKGFAYDPNDSDVRYLERTPLAIFFRVSELDLRVTIFHFELAEAEEP